MSASDQFIEYIIDQFAQGAQTNLQTPGRHGNMVVLTKAMADEVLITGDLHGNRENFNLIKKMAALDAHPRRHLVLQELCHGGPTYAQNNGCMSHTILEDAVILKNKYPRQVHIILGNHELAELTDYPIQKNGQLLNVQFRLGLQHMYGAAAEKIRQSYLPFIQTCPLAVRLPQNEFLSHSIPENCDSQTFDAGIFQQEMNFPQLIEESPLFQLVWGRDFRYENARAFARLVRARMLITGHEPTLYGFLVPNDLQIILDCRANNAACLLLPANRPLSLTQMLDRVQKLA